MGRTMKLSELRFLRERSWLLVTLLTVALVPAFWHLSSWQFHRLHERRTQNSNIARAVAAPAQPLISALSQLPHADRHACSSPLLARCSTIADWTAVNITGHWQPNTTRFARKHWREDVMGFWVTDILRLDSGKEIVVVRGWTPTTKSASESPTVAQPPSGQVNLTGWLMAAEHGTQPNLPMTQIAHVNNASMHVQPALTNMFVIVDLTRTSVAHVATESSGLYGIAVPLPSDGPHHSYAWQWRAFAALVIVGWGALVRTELKQRRGEASAHQAAAVL